MRVISYQRNHDPGRRRQNMDTNHRGTLVIAIGQMVNSTDGLAEARLRNIITGKILRL